MTPRRALDSNEGFVQSGDLPSNRAPEILNRAYCKGWIDAIDNVLEHLESQLATWPADSISPEHLIKHIRGNVQALRIELPKLPEKKDV